MKVRVATIADAKAIEEICSENLVQNRQDLAEKEGFLVTKVTESDAQKMIGDLHHLCLAAESEGEIVGYLTACRLDKSGADTLSQVSILEISKKLPQEKIIFYKHIAKKVGYNGVGSALLETLIKTAKEKNFKTIICRIIHQPIKNLASIAFHQKFGFRLEGERERSDGYVAGLYVKNL